MRTPTWIGPAGWRALVGAVVGVAAVTLILGVLGSRVGQPAPAATVGSPVPGPASTLPSVPLATFEPTTRILELKPWLTVTLPSAPYVPDGERVGSINGIFSSSVIESIPTDSAGGETTWPPIVIAGRIEAGTVIPGDLSATASGLARELAKRAYDELPQATFSEPQAGPVRLAGFEGSRSVTLVAGTLADGRSYQAEVAFTVLALDAQHHFGFVEVRTPGLSPTEEAAMTAARESVSRLP